MEVSFRFHIYPYLHWGKQPLKPIVQVAGQAQLWTR
jgi:hypothetical protein